MKNKHILGLVFFISIALCLGITSCEKDNISSSTDDNQSLLLGKWIKSDGADVLDFKEDGTLIWVRDGIYTFTGSYALNKKQITLCVQEAYFGGVFCGTIQKLTNEEMVIWVNREYGSTYTSERNYDIWDFSRVNN